MNYRVLADFVSQIVSRSRLSNTGGITFEGRRNLYKALGYKRELFAPDYRSRFKRNAVANRLVKALPKATWRGGGEVIEDPDPSSNTAFEQAFEDLNKRLDIWNVLMRADILAGIGRYAVILIGAPGEMNTPLEHCSADDIKYLMPYSEEDAKIFKFDLNPDSERFGQPELYNVTRTTMLSPESTNSNVVGKQVHWTRMIHISDGLLDDRIYGEPRLECVWNLLDDLEKLSGGGSEAYWRRADQGTQFDLDPNLEFDDDDDASSTTKKNAAVKKQIEEYDHGFRRSLFTRGVTINPLSSDVADFGSNVTSIVSLISAGSGIPQRVLMGSEQGKLAAKQDKASWDNRVTDRQQDFAGPCIVRPFVDRLIGFGALPDSKIYEVRFSSINTMDDEQRANIADQWATLNMKMQDIVVTPDEIREHVLQLEPLEGDAAGYQLPVMAQRKLRVMTKTERAQYFGQIKAANKPRVNPAAKQEAELLQVLEAAITHGKMSVVEHLLGITLTDHTETPLAPTPVVIPPVDFAPVLAELNDLRVSVAQKNNDPSLVAAIEKLATRELPTPIVNVTVEQPPPRDVSILRDKEGRIAGLKGVK